MQLLFKCCLGHHFFPIAGHMNAAFPWFEQFDVLVVLAGTENQSDRRFLSEATFIPFEPGQIELHLAFVCRLKSPILSSMATSRRSLR